MSEEIKVEDPIVPNEGTPIPGEQTPQVSAIEQQALDMGWRPRTEFDGSDDEFIDAKEFVRRKPLFDKIEHNSKELRSVRKALDDFKKHFNSMKEVEVTRAINALKAAQAQAVTDQDGETFIALDKQIKESEKQVDIIRAEQTAPPEPELQPEFLEWQTQNRWYSKDDILTLFADALANRRASQGVDPVTIMREVSAAVRKEFPHKFVNARKAGAPDVGQSGGTRAPVSDGNFRLSEDQERVARNWERQGVMTRAEYIKQLKQIS
jgi:hypothetical protein